MPPFAHPWMAWFLAAAAVPVVIHLIYGLKKRRVPTGAVWMIRQVLQRNARRLRLRDVLLLLLRVAAVVLATAAFARPLGSGGAEGTFLVVLDDSYLARAYAGPDETLFDRLKRELTEALPSRGRFYLVSASGRFEGEYEDARALEAALAGLEPSWETWRPSVVLRRVPEGRIFAGAFAAVSIPDVPEEVARKNTVEVASPPVMITVPPWRNSAALLDLRAEDAEDGLKLTVSAWCGLEGEEGAVLSVEWGDGKRVSKPVRLRPGRGTFEVSAPGEGPSWRLFTVRLDVPDRLEDDNVLFAAVRVFPRPEVFTVCRRIREPVFLSPDYFVLRALEASGRFDVSREEARSFVVPEEGGGRAVVVCVEPDALPEQTVEELLSRGMGVVVFLGGKPAFGLRKGVPASSPERGVVEVPRGSPLGGFSASALGTPRWGAVPVEVPEEGWSAWLSVGGVPVVLKRSDKPLVVVNSEPFPGKADLVRHRIFVPFLVKVVEAAAGAGKGGAVPYTARVGGIRKWPEAVVVTGPDGARYELKGNEEFLLKRPGIFRVSKRSAAGREETEFFGVNLDVPFPLGPGEPFEKVFAVRKERGRRGGGPGRRDPGGKSGPWRLLVLGLLALLLVEMLLGAAPIVRGK